MGKCRREPPQIVMENEIWMSPSNSGEIQGISNMHFFVVVQIPRVLGNFGDANTVLDNFRGFQQNLMSS